MNPAHGLRSLVRQWVVPVESPPIRHSYENAPTPLSSAPLNPSIPAPQFVIPAKAGI